MMKYLLSEKRHIFRKNKGLFILFMFATHILFGQRDGHVFNLDLETLNSTLKEAKSSEDETGTPVTITLPNHTGRMTTYKVFASSVLSEEMSRQFPDFMTYSIRGVENSLAFGRIFISRFGLQGVIMSGTYKIQIEPRDKNNPVQHVASLVQDLGNFECGSNEEAKIIKGAFSGIRNPNGGTIRQYEMAIACTGEFYQHASFGNNNLTQANAAVVNIINNVNIYWNAEMSILMTIFQNPIIYTNPSTDPFDPSGSNLTSQASSAIHSNFPSGGYDLGHAIHGMSGGGSGVAAIGVVCNNAISGGGRVNSRGWSGGSNQSLLSLGIMVHELGHMFNSPHTFNGSELNCNTSQHSVNTGYEIGSGSTIMSYAGICGSHNVQSSQDLYFHSKSLELFYNYVTSAGTCSTNTSSGNAPPTADATVCNGPYTLPIMTPFELTGSGTDPNGNSLTYVWEQIDEDGAGVRPTHGFIGSTAGGSNIAPLFRSFLPTASGFKRTFPSQNLLVANNYSSSFEPLPSVTRTLNFRLTARDNVSPHGAFHYDNITISVDGTKGPLTVTAPNTAITVTAGSNLSCTWTVSNTNLICNSMNILLSVDGGATWTYTLATSTANDGSQTVLIPSNIPSTSSARIRIESNCLSCVRFFDISNANFTITSSCNVVSHNICNVAPVTAPEGSSNLNLGLTQAYGISFTTQTMVPSGAAVLSALHSGSSPGTGGCTSLNFGDRAAVVRFKPSVSGTYVFNMSGGFRHLTIYAGDYIPSQPCTNFLGSTAFGGGQISNPISLTLNSCSNYTAVFFDVSGTNGTMTITPPNGGNVYIDNPPSNTNYSYTYMAVNSSTNIITGISATANFTGLLSGSYCVYGLYYHSGAANPPGMVNPSAFIGQTLSNFLNSGSCIQLSQNCKPVEVTPVCSAIVSSTADDGPGTLRRAVTCNQPGTTVTFLPSITQINLNSSLIIDKNLILQGASSTTRPEIIFNAGNFTINTGKILTLHHVDIRYTGSQTIQGGGTLNITGFTRSRQ